MAKKLINTLVKLGYNTILKEALMTPEISNPTEVLNDSNDIEFWRNQPSGIYYVGTGLKGYPSDYFIILHMIRGVGASGPNVIISQIGINVSSKIWVKGGNGNGWSTNNWVEK